MTENKPRLWVHRKGDRYIPIACSAWMNETGYGFTYAGLGALVSTQGQAISQGVSATGSDDFNLGVIRGGRLVALLWMDEVVDDAPDVLTRVAEQVTWQDA